MPYGSRAENRGGDIDGFFVVVAAAVAEDCGLDGFAEAIGDAKCWLLRRLQYRSATVGVACRMGTLQGRTDDCS